MINSLFGKIMGSYVLIPLLILLALILLLPQALEDYIFANKEQELLRKADLVKEILASEQIKNLEARLTDFERALDMGIIVINQEGEIINRGQQMRGMMNSNFNREMPMHQGMMRRGNMRHKMGPGMMMNSSGERSNLSNRLLGLDEGIDKVLAGQTVTVRGDSPMLEQPIIGVGIPAARQALFLLSPIRGLREMVYKIRNLTLQIAVAAVIITLMIAYFLTKGIVRPVQEMKQKAQQMAAGDFAVRLDNLPQDEVGELGRNFNYLAAELETKVSELNAEKNRMHSMLTSMAEGVLGVNQDKRILLANPKLKELFSLDDKVVGRLLTDQFRVELKELVTQILSEETENKLEFETEDKIITAHGAPIYKNQTELCGAIILVRDVTQIRQLEEMRRLFVANASHELKTPLTSVQGYVEAILDGMVEEAEQQREYLQRVLSETNRMSRLVVDILDLSRLQSGQMELEKIEFDIVKVINSVISNLEAKLTNRQVELELPESCLVVGDRDRIQDVLVNLLSNAAKFTAENGSIKIESEPAEEQVWIHVIDDGVGIPAGEQQYIWERFHQVDRARRPDEEGTGLGLAIVKETIENLGGEVAVESKVGQGSDFMFSLPQATEKLK